MAVAHSASGVTAVTPAATSDAVAEAATRVHFQPGADTVSARDDARELQLRFANALTNARTPEYFAARSADDEAIEIAFLGKGRVAIHGIVGDIGTGPSTLVTECNEAYYAELAWQIWGGLKLATAFADDTATSADDMVYDNGIHEAQDGGALKAACHPDIVAAGLCGPVHVE